MIEKKEAITTMQQLKQYCLDHNKRAVFNSGQFRGLKYQGDWI